MFVWKRPTDDAAMRLIEQSRTRALTYSTVGVSRSARAPRGYAVKHFRLQLGEGLGLFQQACQLMIDWQMLPSTVDCVPAAPDLEEGESFAMRIPFFGLWVVNACRIVYSFDDILPNGGLRFGFGMGTLPGHVTSGEERFLLEWLPDDSVWYDIYSYSRPRSAVVWIGLPILRWQQRRFLRESATRLRGLVTQRG